MAVKKIHQEFIVQSVDAGTVGEMIAFLKRHEDFSLFLMSSYETCGCYRTADPNSGNFKFVRSADGKITAAFCLTVRGNLLVVSEIIDTSLFDIIISSCLEEKMAFKGLIGDWNFCDPFWNYLKTKQVIYKDLFVSKEILYSVSISRKKIYEQPNVRFLHPADYPAWSAMRTRYLMEMNIPCDLDEQQNHMQFLNKAKDRIIWGYFDNKELLSVAELNAKAFNMAQMGGVYTLSSYRRGGLSKAVMLQMMRDCKIIHGIQKLLIFTGDENLPARRLYESLGVLPIGYFALMFGEAAADAL